MWFFDGFCFGLFMLKNNDMGMLFMFFNIYVIWLVDLFSFMSGFVLKLSRFVIIRCLLFGIVVVFLFSLFYICINNV